MVDDELEIRKVLRLLLENAGHSILEAKDGVEAVEAVRSDGNIDLCIMDIMMPRKNGVEATSEIRTFSPVPILFLTAKDEEMDVVRGLDSGGNDYVTKPFRMQELLSRIRALLRRNQRDTTITRSGITLDTAKLQATRDGEVLLLTVTEYKILAKLISSRSIITRAVLLEALWDLDSRFVDDNTLSVHVSRLREKIGGSHIKTIRGVGYQWVD